MRARAPPTPRPPRPQQPIPRQAVQHTLPAMPPRGPTSPDTTDIQEARRPAQPRPAPARRIRSTSGATSGIQRALPTTTKQTGGLSRVYERAKPATTATATLITTTNGTSTPARAQTQRRSTPGVAVARPARPRPRRVDRAAGALRAGPRVGTQAAALPACFTNPGGSPATPANRSCASHAIGPGHANSSRPSRACRRSRPRPADPRRPPPPIPENYS